MTPAAAAAAAAAAGATSTRITVDWRTVEPQRGSRNFGAYDAVYDAAVAQGLKPLLVVAFTPAWARPLAACLAASDCTVPPTPAHDGDFAAFAAAVAARYPQAAGIEVWNEPNQRRFWGGARPDPARYAQLLKATYAAVKAVNPALPVVTGGLASYDGEDGERPGLSARAFLDGLYAAGAKGAYDGIGLHPYTSYQLWYGFRAITQVKEAEANAGDSTPLWFTELNVSTTGAQAVTAADQARYLRRFVPSFRARGDVRGVYAHTLYEPAWADGGSTDRGYGVLTAAGTPKPAYCALAARYMQPVCAPPGPDPAQTARWSAEGRLQAAVEAAIRYRASKHTYAGLTSAGLHALDRSLSARAPSGDAVAGARARPARIAVAPGADGRSLIVCNASKADRTYCVWSPRDGRWVYGSGRGSISATSAAITSGATRWW